MKRTYITGDDDHVITLGVKISTLGTACTSVFKAHGGGQEIKIADSTDESGNIREIIIGKASELKDNYILIISIIDLSSLDRTEWDNTSIRYHLNGGSSGSLAFIEDIDDTKMMPNGKLLVTKPIELK